ncbi:MAG TPA: tetratricopeptide repeat protein [Elusimicrobiales bacterium]|nr:tetratricopeptide repeat protein [Elusimicrobiales bacterium]
MRRRSIPVLILLCSFAITVKAEVPDSNVPGAALAGQVLPAGAGKAAQPAASGRPNRRARAWAALQRDPQKAEANLSYGQELEADGDAANAIPYLKKAIALDTQASGIKAWALNSLGKAYFALGDQESAKNSLLESVRLNAAKNVTEASTRQLHYFGFDELFKTWEIRESDHFIFHFQTPSAVPDHEEYIKKHEDALAVITAFFDNVRLPFKIQMFVWNSKGSALKSVGFKLGFAVTESGLIHTSFDQTAGHEPAHVVEYYFAHAAKMASFINEGVAVYLNQYHDDNLANARYYLRSGKKPVSIKELWLARNYLPSDHYALAGAFAGYLVERGGKEKYLGLMRHQSYEEALEIYGPQLDAIVGDFEKLLYSPEPAASI